MNMNPGKQVEMYFLKEEGKDPVDRAQEYLENPNRNDIYQKILQEYGTRDSAARSRVRIINDKVGFPLTFWDSTKPDIINYCNTRQIEEFIQESQKKAA